MVLAKLKELAVVVNASLISSVDKLKSVYSLIKVKSTLGLEKFFDSCWTLSSKFDSADSAESRCSVFKEMSPRSP